MATLAFHRCGYVSVVRTPSFLMIMMFLRITTLSRACRFVCAGILAMLALSATLSAREGEWFSAQPGWAVQKLDWSKREQPSSAWRVLVAEGTGSVPLVGWTALSVAAPTAKVRWSLSREWDGNRDYSGETDFASSPEGLRLPELVDGPWWLDVKTFDAVGGLFRVERFFLNLWNSKPQSQDVAAAAAGGARVAQINAGVVEVSAGHAEWAEDPGVTVEMSVFGFGGPQLGSHAVPMVSSEGEPRRWALPVAEATPGRALRVIVSVKREGRPVDGEELWMAMPGDSSPTPVWEPTDAPPRPLNEIFSGETVSSFLPVEKQRRGLELQLAGMQARGSGAVQLWIQWGCIEVMPGAYDWRNLDDYVAYLTERRIPFTLAGIGGVLFGNGPLRTWGDWTLSHDGRYKLWRNLPVMSPASEAWRQEAAEFARRVIERYRGNPWLVGYVFMGQGMDSCIYADHYDTVTDYSPSARADFVRYLQGKYAEIGALNASWGSEWTDWTTVCMPLPRFELEVNLSQPWQDFTEWKLDLYRRCTTAVFDLLVAKLDPKRTVLHYVVKTGPFEYLLQGEKFVRWSGADGAGEDHRMGRINGLTDNWGLWRQTESHDVPPANRRYMMDMVSQTLRGESDHIRFNLVWNTTASLFEAAYPANAELRQSMDWWSETAGLRQRLASSIPPEAELGVVVSWADMLHRLRAWRWYAMTGNRADQLVRSAGFQPVRWLTEWAPDAAWDGLKTVLVPEDALVWDARLRSRLRRHVGEGGEVVVWGRSGQYAPDDRPQNNGFGWVEALGGEGLQVKAAVTPEERQKATVMIGGSPRESSPAVIVQSMEPEAGTSVMLSDSFGRPAVLGWSYGKGSVRWCLLDTPEVSEALVTGLINSGGVTVRVSSSAPGIEGVLRQDGERRLLVLSRFLGYGRKADPAPLRSLIRVADMPGEWMVKRLSSLVESDETAVPTWAEFKSGAASVALLPSEMQVYEFSPHPPRE